jgi:hypothetical protein
LLVALGFTHYCTTSRKGGWFVIGRKTVKKRMRAQLRVIKDELRKRLHAPVAEVGAWLNRVLRGHLNYYAVPGNGQSLSAFIYQVGRYMDTRTAATQPAQPNDLGAVWSTKGQFLPAGTHPASLAFQAL